MDKNYYEILSVKRNANQYQIADAYRKLVLRWHPKYAKEDRHTSMHHFSEISQAYEVLSNPLNRAFYDLYGYRKLREGFFIDGQLKGGYRFGNNPQEIFERFFKSTNVLAQCLDQKIIQKGSIFSSAFGALNYTDTYTNEDLKVKVPCSLNELYQGVAKKVSYSRKVLNLDGKTLTTSQQEKLLQIKAGWGQGSTIVFKEQGNENISRNKSDLIFILEEIPHPNYSRVGDNLIYIANITLADALSCVPLTIRTLDDRILRVSLDEIPKYLFVNLSVQNLKEVEGEGMPISGSKDKGNLYIKFNISFPKSLKEQAKLELHSLLAQ